LLDFHQDQGFGRDDLSFSMAKNNNAIPLRCNELKSESKGLLCSVTYQHNLLSERRKREEIKK
jgi:hypothetical protein